MNLAQIQEPTMRWTLKLAVLVLVLTFILPPPAFATNFGSTTCSGTPRNCVNLLKNTNGSAQIGFFSVPAGFTNAVLNRITNVYTSATTDVEFTNIGNASPTNGVLVWEVDNPATSFVAWVDCYGAQTGSNPNKRCQVIALYANSDNFDTSVNGNYQKGIACHELGHTVGLRHTSGTSCLVNPPSGTRLTLPAHDKNHLKAAYT